MTKNSQSGSENTQKVVSVRNSNSKIIGCGYTSGVAICVMAREQIELECLA